MEDAAAACWPIGIIDPRIRCAPEADEVGWPSLVVPIGLPLAAIALDVRSALFNGTRPSVASAFEELRRAYAAKAGTADSAAA